MIRVFSLFFFFLFPLSARLLQDLACKEEILMQQALPASSFFGVSYFIVCNNIVILYFSLWGFLIFICNVDFINVGVFWFGYFLMGGYIVFQDLVFSA